MKVLAANSIILGTKKLCGMFPIKQKLKITAGFFFYNKNVLNKSLFFDSSLCCLFENQAYCTMVKKSPNLPKLKNLDYLKELPLYDISA